VLTIASTRSTLAGEILTFSADPRALARRRFGPGEGVDAVERCPTAPVDPGDLPCHVVASDREFTAGRSSQRIEGEHITRHVPLERSGTTRTPEGYYGESSDL